MIGGVNRPHALPRRTPTATLAALAVSFSLVLAACGGGGSSDDAATTTSAPKTSTTAADSTAPLTILVSNDDGYKAEGIDVLTSALVGMAGTEVIVYAPLEQQSGTGGKTTEGELAVTDVNLLSGHPAKAVDGFPADSVQVAMDEDGVKPDLVVTGINEGQNLGPVVDLSGTVGAARAAVARGVPALAVSQGSGPLDYASAVPLVLGWIRDHRADIVAGKAAVNVTNMNVPSCKTGSLKGPVLVKADLGGDVTKSLAEQDCSAEPSPTKPAYDVPAFMDGYATISVIPSEPATPAEVVPAGA